MFNTHKMVVRQVVDLLHGLLGIGANLERHKGESFAQASVLILSDVDPAGERHGEA